MFVMMADDGQNRSKRLQRLADIFAYLRMQTDGLPLIGTQVCALFQYLVGDGNLPQVMQESSTPQCHLIIKAQTEMRPEFAGIGGKSLAMAFGVGIAGF